MGQPISLRPKPVKKLLTLTRTKQLRFALICVFFLLALSLYYYATAGFIGPTFATLAFAIVVVLSVSSLKQKKRSPVIKKDPGASVEIMLPANESSATVFTSDLGGTFTFIGGQCHSLTGYTCEELTGKSFSMLIPEEWVSVVSDEYATQLRQLWKETTIEFPITTRNGQQKWVEQHGMILYDEHHSPIGYRCTVKDITERRQQDESSQEGSLASS
jgi:PAS domain S-box-containing protein